MGAEHERECKGSETKQLIPFVESLQQSYGNTSLFQAISVDAGMVSRANALSLREKGLHYIMALKGSQGTLHEIAKIVFENDSPPSATTTDKHGGHSVTRTAFRVPVNNIEHWEHATELWKVHSVSVHPKTHETTEETRFFLTSIPLNTLSASQVLEAVRMRWGIENCANWTLDALWKGNYSG